MIFDPILRWRHTEAKAPDPLASLRYRGWRGGTIIPHRAFRRLRLRRRDVVTGAALVAALSSAWLLLLRPVGQLWGAVFEFWARQLHLSADIVMVPQHWGGYLHFAVPYLNLPAGAPDPLTWWTTAAVTLAVAVASFVMPREMLPWIYIARFLVILQTTSLVYFAFAAARFPRDLASYVVGMLVFGVILVGLIPLILGFTFYLFDFSFFQKLGLTVLIMAHLALFVPLQYMLHAYVLHASILYMPVLYFAFGPFLDVLVFISFYSWGMSWESRQSLLST